MARRREYLRTSEVANILGISKQTLHNWQRSGKIPTPARTPVSRYCLWKPEDVERIRRILAEEARA